MNIEIRQNKKSKAIWIIVILLFMSASLCILGFYILPMLPGFYKFKTAVIASIFAVMIFALFVLGKQLLSKKPAFIISDLGITDNSSAYSLGFVPWPDITGFREAENAFKQKLLLFMLKNPFEYLNRPGIKMKSVHENYYKTFGTPVVVSFSSLKCDYHEFLNAIKRYKEPSS